MTENAIQTSDRVETLGTAEAKRRFSELVDRVGTGEKFLILRRHRPAVALVPPDPHLLKRPDVAKPTGLASIAGALAEWDDFDAVVAEIYAARKTAMDRPVPDLE